LVFGILVLTLNTVSSAMGAPSTFIEGTIWYSSFQTHNVPQAFSVLGIVLGILESL
jgi:hypothetical protein